MRPSDFPTAVRLTLASPEQIRSWSSGEVTAATTLDYLTLKPERDGLFSEQIFGPVTSWHCACGAYKRARTPGFRCRQCDVELADRWVRRERLGHIELATPIAHPWFANRTPNPLAILLDLSPRTVKQILSATSVVVVRIDERQRACLRALPPEENDAACADGLATTLHALQMGAVLDASLASDLRVHYGPVVQIETGAQALRTRLEALDLETLAQDLRQMLASYTQPEVSTKAPADPLQKKHARRLHLVETFRASGVQPAWMILSVLPVLPPELRPLIPLPGGRVLSADLNTHYERILHRNQRLRALDAANAPEVILTNERRLLQEACDALFDNGHRAHPSRGPQGQPLKSLTDVLSGKEGRFRKNLLGKRVDYSGRSVIVGDATLLLHQCGLPTKICLELFQPLLIRKLLEHHQATSPRAAKRMIERPRLRPPILWDLLEEVLFEQVVLLNRAPTLHRLSIQAFEVRRVEGDAIRLHPLLCSGFNADFDGDQMAVHLPLSQEAQREARDLLLSTRNLRTAANGEPAISLSQDMVLGLFYLTQDRPSTKSAGRCFADAMEAHLAFSQDVIDLHTPIMVRLDATLVYESDEEGGHVLPARSRIETTVGRLLFNEILPVELGYRNYAQKKESLKLLIAMCLQRCGAQVTATVADRLKQLGFRYATRSGLSFALSDITVPPEKKAMLDQADTDAAAIETQYQQGMITAEERHRTLITHWTQATEQISHHLEAALDPWGSLSTIIQSGATKAKFQQIRQLSGIRGLMARPSGEIIDIPIRGNYLEGLNGREIFIASSAARNGFMGRSLNTATTGYLTRKLVEAGMEVWITQEECGTTEGLLITQEESQAIGLPDFRSRIMGRLLAEPVLDCTTGMVVDARLADHLFAQGVTAVRVRSVLLCQAPYGVCQGCYGSDLSTGLLVPRGMAVGVIAGQSIGEPGTQLSMKAFHSGGIANAQGDIRQGLPRVIELFEARPPQPAAPLARRAGTVHLEIQSEESGVLIRITPTQASGEEPWQVMLPRGQTPLVASGQWIEVGTPLANGACALQDILELLGCEATARYLINEVQHVFRGTGVTLHEKHLDCIVRQMLRFVQVRFSGDTPLIAGTVLDRFAVDAQNRAVIAQGGQPAVARPVVLGLTKAAFQTSSWIAAASFQETSRVLMQAALGGQCDPLRGIKERVVVGLPLPR